MGNRAVITTLGNEKGIYLHWNGGYDSIKPLAYYSYYFLEEEKNELEKFKEVAKYCNFNPEENSLLKLDFDNYDNGLYFIKNGKIVGRAFYHYNAEQNEHNLYEFLQFINENMPLCYRLDLEYIIQHTFSTEYTYLDDLKQDVRTGDLIEVYNTSGKHFYKIEAIENQKNIIYINYSEFSPNMFKLETSAEVLKNPNSQIMLNEKIEDYGHFKKPIRIVKKCEINNINEIMKKLENKEERK